MKRNASTQKNHLEMRKKAKQREMLEAIWKEHHGTNGIQVG
jgi:hypothetical protein